MSKKALKAFDTEKLEHTSTRSRARYKIDKAEPERNSVVASAATFTLNIIYYFEFYWRFGLAF